MACASSAPSSAKNASGAAPPYDLEQFEVIRDLGNGAFGTVKEVRKKDDGKTFAMKLIDKQQIQERKCQVDTEKMLIQVKREVLIQLKARHPNVVQLVYYFEDKSRIYCLLECADGGQLFRYLRAYSKGLPSARAALFFGDVARGLEYLHGLGIIHRDVKPENILLFGKDLRAKLADFGWCVELTEKEPERHTFCGTLDYLAPEMLNGNAHGTPVDLWALGVLLFEMLIAKAPFTTSSQKATMENIVACKFDIPAGMMPVRAEILVRALLLLKADARMPAKSIICDPWLTENFIEQAPVLPRAAMPDHVREPTPSHEDDVAALDATRPVVRTATDHLDVTCQVVRRVPAVGRSEGSRPAPPETDCGMIGLGAETRSMSSASPRPHREAANNRTASGASVERPGSRIPSDEEKGAVASSVARMMREAMGAPPARGRTDLELSNADYSADYSAPRRSITMPLRSQEGAVDKPPHIGNGYVDWDKPPRCNIFDTDLLSTVDDTRILLEDIDDQLLRHSHTSNTGGSRRFSESILNNSLSISSRSELQDSTRSGDDVWAQSTVVVRDGVAGSLRPMAKRKSNRRSSLDSAMSGTR